MLNLVAAGIVSRTPKVIDTKNPDFKLVSIPVTISERVKRGESWEYENTYIDATKIVKSVSADKFASLFSPGTYVAFEGKPSARAYTNKNGEVIGQISLMIKDIEPQGVNEAFAAKASSGEQKKIVGVVDPIEAEPQDDDLPF